MKYLILAYTCPTNSSYVYYGSPCNEKTCFLPNSTYTYCPESSRDRCQCDQGFLRDSTGYCIRETDCGCRTDTSYHSVFKLQYLTSSEISCHTTLDCYRPPVENIGASDFIDFIPPMFCTGGE